MSFHDDGTSTEFENLADVQPKKVQTRPALESRFRLGLEAMKKRLKNKMS